MSNLSRWEPVREMLTLREAMNQLFDDSFTRPLGMGVNRLRLAVLIPTLSGGNTVWNDLK